MTIIVCHCEACGHEWPELLELPMRMDAFVERITVWRKCPKCGNKSRAKGKQVMMLTDDLYRKAVDRFVQQGRLPARIKGQLDQEYP